MAFDHKDKLPGPGPTTPPTTLGGATSPSSTPTTSSRPATPPPGPTTTASTHKDQSGPNQPPTSQNPPPPQNHPRTRQEILDEQRDNSKASINTLEKQKDDVHAKGNSDQERALNNQVQFAKAQWNLRDLESRQEYDKNHGGKSQSYLAEQIDAARKELNKQTALMQASAPANPAATAAQAGAALKGSFARAVDKVGVALPSHMVGEGLNSLGSQFDKWGDQVAQNEPNLGGKIIGTFLNTEGGILHLETISKRRFPLKSLFSLNRSHGWPNASES